MSERTWIARPYKLGDEEGIFELRRITYPDDYDHDKWMEHWHWLYQQNPAGRSYIWVAEDGGKIVAHAATIPVMVKFGDRILRSRLGTNAMTHPGYRGQGAYPVLRINRDKEAAKDGIRTHYSFSGRGAAHRINLKYSYTVDVRTTSIMLRPYNWRNSLRLALRNNLLVAVLAMLGSTSQAVLFRARKAPSIPDLDVSRVSTFDERADALFNDVSGQHQIMVVRNKDYLNWRYVSIPNIDYSIYVAETESRLRGYMVTRPVVRNKTVLGVIYDTLAVSPEVLHVLAAHAAEQLRMQGADLVYSSMMARRPLLSAFRGAGLMRVPFAGNGFNVGSNDSDVSKEFISNPDNWYAQIGDSDFF